MKECESRICMAIVAISRTLARCNYPLSTSTFITPCSIFDIQFHFLWRSARRISGNHYVTLRPEVWEYDLWEHDVGFDALILHKSCAVHGEPQ